MASPIPVDGFASVNWWPRGESATAPPARCVHPRRIRELSLEEIARAMDTNVGAVKSRLHRGRENLRRMLAPLRDEMKRRG